MAGKLHTAVLAILATVALLQSSVAATVYVVGDNSGWTIPAGGAATYSAWAANKTFVIGDILSKFHFPFFLHTRLESGVNLYVTLLSLCEIFLQPSTSELELMM